MTFFELLKIWFRDRKKEKYEELGPYDVNKLYNFEDYCIVRNSKVCSDIPLRYYIFQWIRAIFFAGLITTIGAAYWYAEYGNFKCRRFTSFQAMGGFEALTQIYFSYKGEYFCFQFPVIIYLFVTGFLFLVCFLRFGFSEKTDWNGFFNQNREITEEDRLAMKDYRGAHFLRYFFPLLLTGHLFWVVGYDCIIMVMDAKNVYNFVWLEYFNYRWPWTPYIIKFDNYTLVRYVSLEDRINFIDILLAKLPKLYQPVLYCEEYWEIRRLKIEKFDFNWEERLFNIDYTQIDMNWSACVKYDLASKHKNLNDLSEAVFARVCELNDLYEQEQEELRARMVIEQHAKDRRAYFDAFIGRCMRELEDFGFVFTSTWVVYRLVKFVNYFS